MTRGNNFPKKSVVIEETVSVVLVGIAVSTFADRKLPIGSSIADSIVKGKILPRTGHEGPEGE